MRTVYLLLLMPALFLLSCQNTLKQAFTTKTPYEQYIKSLEMAGLETTPMVQSWIAAGLLVFQDSVLVDLPFSESGFMEASAPEARGYRFTAKEGQVLHIRGTLKATNNSRLFVELFALDDSEWKLLEHTTAAADSGFSLTYETPSTTQYLLRLQPELLSQVYYTLSISLNPALINPVQGAVNRSIGSLYGVDRDGGRRKHEGVDIFAARGTPVLAPASGFVSRVGTTPLGGKVVWLQDAQRAQSYYFAHLDTQLVSNGKQIQAGDTLGLVGNTGNARSTPPHLHFGIYQRGSKDPIHYLLTLPQAVAPVSFDTALITTAHKVASTTALLRSGPGKQHLVLRKLDKDTYITLHGQSSEWYRVHLADGTVGFLTKKSVERARPGTLLTLTRQLPVLTAPYPNAVPLGFVDSASTVKVLAVYNDFHYVHTAQQQKGWIHP